MNQSNYQDWKAQIEFKQEHYARHIIVFHERGVYWFNYIGDIIQCKTKDTMDEFLSVRNYTYDIVEIKHVYS